MIGGVRANGLVSLESREIDDTWRALASGSRSLIYKFSAGSDGSSISFGAMISTEDQSPLKWGDTGRKVRLNFWDDEARLYVYAGAEFLIWYGQIIGNGIIVDLSE
jgi:hypothetical protein